MNSNESKTESRFFEKVRVALTNSLSNPQIKPLLASFGVNKIKVDEGWAVYNKAKDAWEINKTEDTESTIASNSLKKSYSEFEGLFKRHRHISIIFFKKHPDFLVKLGVKGNFPDKYNELFDKSKEYYEAIQSNPDIQKELIKCKITPKIVVDCLSKHSVLLSKRAEYEKEEGESQDATEIKNSALLELREWKEDFDIIAKVALYDHPQLLEVLGIFVRS